MAVVTMLNQKGGVGKTSTCHHLAGTLAQAGRKSCSWTTTRRRASPRGSSGPEAHAGHRPGRERRALYDPHLCPIPERVIRPTGFDGVAIVPGSDGLTGYNITPTRTAGRPPSAGCREFLDEVPGGLRPGADRLPAEPPPLLVGGPGGLRLPRRPAPGRGLRGPGARRPCSGGVAGGPRRGRTRAGAARATCSRCSTSGSASTWPTRRTLREMYGRPSSRRPSRWPRTSRRRSPTRQPISHYKPKVGRGQGDPGGGRRAAGPHRGRRGRRRRKERRMKAADRLRPGPRRQHEGVDGGGRAGGRGCRARSRAACSTVERPSIRGRPGSRTRWPSSSTDRRRTPTSPGRNSTRTELGRPGREPQGPGPAPADPGPLGRGGRQVGRSSPASGGTGPRTAGGPGHARLRRGHGRADRRTTSWRTSSSRTASARTSSRSSRPGRSGR